MLNNIHFRKSFCLCIEILIFCYVYALLKMSSGVLQFLINKLFIILPLLNQQKKLLYFTLAVLAKGERAYIFSSFFFFKHCKRKNAYMLLCCTIVNHILALNSPGFYLEVNSNSAVSDLTIELSVASITLIYPVIYRKVKSLTHKA